MSVYTAEQLQEVVWKHGSWLRSEDGGERADLSNADLSNAYLSNADLSNAYLSNADLRNADLRYADLRNADLRYADLSNAYLRNADLRYADLRNADLSNADLRYADLEGITVSWNAHALLSEILFRAAGRFLGHQALAALIARRTNWCWAVWVNDEAPAGIGQDEWENIVIAHREWALSELAKWVKDGDYAPEVVRQYAQREVPA